MSKPCSKHWFTIDLIPWKKKKCIIKRANILLKVINKESQ